MLKVLYYSCKNKALSKKVIDMKRIINKSMISLNSNFNTKSDVIMMLADLMDREGVINDLDKYVENVKERESLTSTGIGFGIAIPHGKCSFVNSCAVGFCRLNKPIDWESIDGDPVDTVFLLAVPDECAGNEHLKIIAALSRKLIHEEFRNFLKTSEDPDELSEVINDSLKEI